jgi:phage shock protein PspC (stress-responsive transcriptional regulator)
MVARGARRQAGAMNTTTSPTAGDQTSHAPYESAPPRTLSRPVEGRMLGGVAAGLARYLDIDVTVVRILFAVLTLVGGAAIPVYLAAWLLIPEDGADESIAAGVFRPRAG